MRKELFVELKENSYMICIEKGLLDNLAKEIKDVYNGEKIFLLTDENVDKYYGDKVVEGLESAGFKIKKLVLPPGEETKSFNTLPMIYNELLDFKLTRNELIITLGGGVIGDLGGFAASSYLRGVPFIQIPTSLLAQVDSSVGGKVGVDLEKGKNLVGSFYQPKKVIIDPNVLNSLEDKFYKDGMAEVIKYGCIKDKKFFNFLGTLYSREDVMNNIEHILYTCCKIKKTVVENDERDLGERMLLNFGHTYGHAIEKYYNFTGYSHGEAVAIGMYVISKISESRGISKEGTTKLILDILNQYGLPYKVEVKESNEITKTISLDKKNIGSILKVILLNEIGESIIYDTNVEFFKDVM